MSLFWHAFLDEAFTSDRIGIYEIIGVLGRGGMGEVFRARDTLLGRDVAIKVLAEEFSAELLILQCKRSRVMPSGYGFDQARWRLEQLQK